MLDVIVPCFNEEQSIKNFYDKTNEELKNIKHTFIFVDDGSKDKTLKILKEIYNIDNERVRIISFSRNFGKEAAMYAGLSHSKGDYACIIDADLQQNPKYLVKMYNFLNSNNNYDSVCMCQKQIGKRFFQNSFYTIINSISDVKFENGASDFRMFNKTYVKSLMLMCEKNRFSKGIFSYVGFNTYYEEYDVEERKAGVSKWNFKKLLAYAYNGIVAFSSKPLRLSIYSGIFLGIGAFIYLITILIRKDNPDYAPFMCIVLFINSFLFIQLGIVGEYIGKTYNEAKNRPLYVAKELVGYDDSVL